MFWLVSIINSISFVNEAVVKFPVENAAVTLTRCKVNYHSRANKR